MVLALAAFTATLVGAAKFDDLPAELKNVPESAMIKYEGAKISLYRNGKRIQDADSSSTSCILWIPGKGMKYHLPFGMGVYDYATKKGVVGITLKTVAQNEKFNWYKIGSGTIGKSSMLYLTDWHISINLKNLYKEGDSNKYEFWLSLKCQGPAYVKDSKKENALIVDRALIIKK